MSTSPLAGTVQRPLVLLAILLLIAPVHAQTSATAEATVLLQEPDVANGTGIVIADIRLDVANHLCTGAPTFTIQLVASSDAGLPVRVAPAILDIPVGQDDALAGATETRAAAITIGPAPPGTTANVVLEARPPTGGCGTVQRSGDTANTTVEWVVAEPDEPERLMPVPGAAWLLLLLGAALRGGPKKPMAISSP